MDLKTAFIMLIWCRIHILCCLGLNENRKCYELPVLIVTPKEPFPTEACHALEESLPHQDCMKKAVLARVAIIDNMRDEYNCLGDTPTLEISGSMHYRGSSSLGFKKHQYALDLSSPSKVLNLPAGSSWILNGPWKDSSLLRNHLAHWLFRGTGRYSPRSAHFVLYIQESLDEKPVFYGIYLLLEKISFEPNRLALSANSKFCQGDEINGGWAWQYNPVSFGDYIVNLELDSNVNMFGQGARPILMYPPGEQLTESMRNYFVSQDIGILPQFFKYLANMNSYSMNDISSYIDVGSYVDYFLHTEMALNQDGYTRSVWFFKDRDGPINAGPVWDFNIAYGAGIPQVATATWSYHNQQMWKALMCNYNFAGLAIRRWKQLREGPWSEYSVKSFIVNAALPIQRMLQECTGGWQSNNTYCANTAATGTYETQLQSLIDAVLGRAQWLDASITELYMPVNASFCGQQSSLPFFNCGPDPEDAGCLENPKPYYTEIPIPSVPQPYAGPGCMEELDLRAAIKLESASVDPCWLSVGISVTDSSFTPCCSGYGFCPPGPNATCACNNNSTNPNCSPAVATRTPESSYFSRIGRVTIAIVLLAAFSTVFALRMWTRRSSYMEISTGTTSSFEMNSERRVSNYGM